MLKKCVICGIEFEAGNRKNSRDYCDNNGCKKQFYKKNKSNDCKIKDIVKEDVCVKTHNTILEPKIEDIKSEFQEQLTLNKYLKDALNLIFKHKGESVNIQHLFTRQSELDKLVNDYMHIIELVDLKTPEEVNDIMTKYRKVLIERRVVKDQINIYKSIQKLDGFSKIDFKELNQKKYHPRRLDCGTITCDSELDLGNLSEKECVNASEQVSDTSEYDAYVDGLNSVDNKNRFYAKSIRFVEGNIKDLKSKVGQMEAKYSIFRVEGNTLNCYN